MSAPSSFLNKRSLLHHKLKLTQPQVGLVRTPSQLGLIQARLAGARAATGSFIVFLDSHCEATKGWLEPMAQRMKEDPTVVQIPRLVILKLYSRFKGIVSRIDMIDSTTLSYYGSGSGSVSVGGFTWSGHFTWEGLPAKVGLHSAIIKFVFVFKVFFLTLSQYCKLIGSIYI